MQHKLSEITDYKVINANDSIIVDLDEGSALDVRRKLECQAIEVSCQLIAFEHVDNFKPPAYERKFYTTILFNPIEHDLR